ncbi:hypothetical protein BCV69DRAFT_314955 [Microstroma glucosiphilum]|uniref:Uncharacterized protein n=1 Tax=Pseudomicrostroma glucosiphilum TaxID=1684307 RepID=A0A316TZN6_9BASI|nr:hypothetical protein BCV69DRAFT_314955 [Pseudomicrostroma glucosiphilum]PWN18114.1 hypothetical protein BCV69DRAFT_314955 [Pseudomicrostroma glucosiphilum]
MGGYLGHTSPYTKWPEVCANATISCHGNVPDEVFRQVIGLSSIFSGAAFVAPIFALVFWKLFAKWLWRSRWNREEKASNTRRMRWNMEEKRRTLAMGKRMPWSALNSPATPRQQGNDRSPERGRAGPSSTDGNRTQYPPAPPARRVSRYDYLGSHTRSRSGYGVRQSVYALAGGITPSASTLSLLGPAPRPHQNSGLIMHSPFQNPHSPGAGNETQQHPLLPQPQYGRPAHVNSPLASSGNYQMPREDGFYDPATEINPSIVARQRQGYIDREIPNPSAPVNRRRSGIRGLYRNSTQINAAPQTGDNNEPGRAEGDFNPPLPLKRGSPPGQGHGRPDYERTFSDDSTHSLSLSHSQSHPLRSENSFYSRDSVQSRVSVRSTRHLLADPPRRQGTGGLTLDDVVRESAQAPGGPGSNVQGSGPGAVQPYTDSATPTGTGSSPLRHSVHGMGLTLAPSPLTTQAKQQERGEEERRLAKELAHTLRYVNHSPFAADWGWQWRASSRSSGAKKRKSFLGRKTRTQLNDRFGEGGTPLAGQGGACKRIEASQGHWSFDDRAIGADLPLSVSHPGEPYSASPPSPYPGDSNSSNGHYSRVGDASEAGARLRRAVAEFHGVGESGPFYR